MGAPQDFIAAYLHYVADTEPPVFFHRWCCIVGLGALLGRQFYLPHGHSIINPNTYCMLMGEPGTRKSTAINIQRGVLQAAGYKTIAASKTTKEKFILDLAGETDDSKEFTRGENILETNLWGLQNDSQEPAETFIMAGEFNNFFGNGNIEFISLLGDLWDFTGDFENRVKNSKSVVIHNPTVSILGGNTATGFNSAFPVDIIGQGFFSRILLVHSEESGRRISFPTPPSSSATSTIVSVLQEIKKRCIGEAILNDSEKKLLDKIYKTWDGIDDPRFASYANRRFTHLLKLCLIISAARLSTQISETDIIYANTILTHTEHLMPKALGEFGKSRHSDVAHSIISMMEEDKDRVWSVYDIWEKVSTNLDKIGDLANLIQSLQLAKKVVIAKGGYTAAPVRIRKDNSDTLDFGMLSNEEIGV